MLRRVDIAYWQVLAIFYWGKLSRKPGGKIPPYDPPYKFTNRIFEFRMGKLFFREQTIILEVTEVIPKSAHAKCGCPIVNPDSSQGSGTALPGVCVYAIVVGRSLARYGGY